MFAYIVLFAFVAILAMLVFVTRREDLSKEHKLYGDAGRSQQSINEIENIKDKYLQFFR